MRRSTLLLATSLASITVAGAARADKPSAPAAAAPTGEAPAAKEEAANPFSKIKFDAGPVKGHLEDLATIDVPANIAFVGGRVEAGKFMEATQNIPSGKEVGVLLPTEKPDWWMVFEFNDVGYVKDDDRDKLDADAILKSLTEGTEDGNAERRRRGWGELHVEGWHTPPRYNPATHNLEWATRLRGSEGISINYEVRLLGRRGVMSATLIASPDKVERAVAELQKLLTGFSYEKEHAYSSFRSGDKIAEYGLVGLIGGGVLAVGLKTGLFAKLWKLFAAGIVAAGAGIKRLFGGGKKDKVA